MMRPAPRYTLQKRPVASARVGRTRPELAAELVRLEYERTRLERSLDSIESRRTTVTEQLTALCQRAAWIRDCLADDPLDASALSAPTLSIPCAAPLNTPAETPRRRPRG